MRTLTVALRGTKRIFISDNEYGDHVKIDNMVAQMGGFPFTCGGDVLFDPDTMQFSGLTFCFYQSYDKIKSWFDYQAFNGNAARYLTVDSAHKLRSDPIRTFSTYTWPVEVFAHFDVIFFYAENTDIAPAQLGLGEIYWWYDKQEKERLLAISIPHIDDVLENSCLSLSPVVPVIALEKIKGLEWHEDKP